MSFLALPIAGIDDVNVEFSESSLLILGFVLAIIMFGIALDTKPADFRAVTKHPKAIAVGIGAQFIVLPAVTFLLTQILGVGPSIALGMILVACCPPGNISNVLTYRAGGNVALSVSMTVISNLLVIFLLPLNLAFWGGLSPETSAILETVNLSAVKMLAEIATIIAIPFGVGLAISHGHPVFARRVQPWVKRFSLIALVAFILIAFGGNIEAFKGHVAVIAVAVFLLDTMALSLGYGIASTFRLSEYNRRAVTFEVGVRNSGIGLGIVFTFFGGLGGMALVAGWWGIWDIIAGLILAGWWAKRGDRHPESAGTAG